MRSDETLPQYIFDKNYTVTIPSKDDWRGLFNIPDDIVCCTDFSKQTLGQSGATVCTQTTGQELVLLLG